MGLDTVNGTFGIRPNCDREREHIEVDFLQDSQCISWDLKTSLLSMSTKDGTEREGKR